MVPIDPQEPGVHVQIQTNLNQQGVPGGHKKRIQGCLVCVCLVLLKAVVVELLVVMNYFLLFGVYVQGCSSGCLFCFRF